METTVHAVILIIGWAGGQAHLPMPDLLMCQAVGATVQSEQEIEVACASTEDLKLERKIEVAL